MVERLISKKNYLKYSHSCWYIAIGRARSVRAYNHRARCNQHCLIVFIKKEKTLLIVNHQISFITHSIILTAMTKEQNIRMNELKYAETLHEEKCYRNIKVSLASIEEHSLADAAFLL